MAGYQKHKNNKIRAGLALLGLLCLSIGVVGQYRSDALTTSASVGGRELPIYCVDTDEKKVALSFDAAWGNEDTARILEILKKNDVHVTFFMTGGWVDSYPEDVKALYEAGHDLGNHSENHKNMSQLSVEECKKEVQLVHDKVKEITGYDMFLFRPPYGDYDNEVITTVREMGYYPIQWDVDSLDWKDYDAKTIFKRVTENLQPGSIVLFHNAALHTPEALPSILEFMQQNGYTVVPIGQLIYTENYTIDHAGRQWPAQEEKAAS